jgi:glycosyltransferase involved in cell wall biosynthesis
VRVLLASNASYDPPRGGSTRANLVWLRHLASQGHEYRVAAAEGPLQLRKAIAEWRPDWVLVSSEDVGHVLLREAFRSAPDRVVYLAHTPQFFPFGPESWNPEPDASLLLKGAAAIVAISRTVAAYIAKHLGRTPDVIHPPMYPSASFCANPQGAVTLINPCAVKGLSIFLALADRFPATPFHALRGWGTTSADEAAMRQRPNIELIDTVADIEQVLARTRILLAPSLWFEGFGLVVTEAMLRGIPVLASDAGGLREAKLGTNGVVPVNPIAHYESRFDERHMPVAIVPVQDIDAWAAPLAELLRDGLVYQSESQAAREAALQFVSTLDAGDLERMLLGLSPVLAAPGPARKRDALTPEQRALLLRKLRQRT